MNKRTLLPSLSACVPLLLTKLAAGALVAGNTFNNASVLSNQDDVGCYVMGTMSMAVHYSEYTPDNTAPKYSDSWLLPETAPVIGNCSSNRTETWIKSIRGIFTLGLVFESQTDTMLDTWALTELTLQKNDQPSSSFPRMTKRGGLKKSGMLMFKTPSNNSYQCDSKQRVIFHSPSAHATLVFSQVRLKPFSDKKNPKSQQGVVCPEDLDGMGKPTPTSTIVAPLVLTICLAVVIALLVLGYMVHRRVGSMGYINMQ